MTGEQKMEANQMKRAFVSLVLELEATVSY